MDIKEGGVVDMPQHSASDKTGEPVLKCNKHGIVLVPQPSDDPEDPLVRLSSLPIPIPIPCLNMRKYQHNNQHSNNSFTNTLLLS